MPARALNSVVLPVLGLPTRAITGTAAATAMELTGKGGEPGLGKLHCDGDSIGSSGPVFPRDRPAGQTPGSPPARLPKGPSRIDVARWHPGRAGSKPRLSAQQQV